MTVRATPERVALSILGSVHSFLLRRPSSAYVVTVLPLWLQGRMHPGESVQSHALRGSFGDGDGSGSGDGDWDTGDCSI